MLTVFKQWEDRDKNNKTIATMDIDIIPEKGSSVVIPLSKTTNTRVRRTYKGMNAAYDYQPVTFNEMTLYQCIVYVEVM